MLLVVVVFSVVVLLDVDCCWCVYAMTIQISKTCITTKNTHTHTNQTTPRIPLPTYDIDARKEKENRVTIGPETDFHTHNMPNVFLHDARVFGSNTHSYYIYIYSV